EDRLVPVLGMPRGADALGDPVHGGPGAVHQPILAGLLQPPVVLRPAPPGRVSGLVHGVSPPVSDSLASPKVGPVPSRGSPPPPGRSAPRRPTGRATGALQVATGSFPRPAAR